MTAKQYHETYMLQTRELVVDSPQEKMIAIAHN
jgi:hypothetical protein